MYGLFCLCLLHLCGKFEVDWPFSFGDTEAEAADRYFVENAIFGVRMPKRNVSVYTQL